MQITDLYRYWQILETRPFGQWLFNRIIRMVNPYTGALKANIKVLRKGYAQLELKDRRGIRNHLNSIHAIALTNLGEFTSGLALISLFTENMRGIPVEIKIEFIKKARGTLSAECTTRLPEFEQELQHTVVANITDTENDIVATITVVWKLAYTSD